MDVEIKYFDNDDVNKTVRTKVSVINTTLRISFNK